MPPLPRPTPLAPLPRALRLGLAFLLLALASPGVVSAPGSATLALAGVALWAGTASRPGPLAALIEILLGGLAWSWVCSWAAFVWWGTLLIIGPGMGLYTWLSGACLRRLARRFPLAVAAPAAWLLSEGLRAVLPPPFGFQWMRLGTHLHEVAFLAGSARVWGFGGLGWLLAALAGLVAQVVSRRPASLLAWTTGLGPAVLAVGLYLAVPAPATVDGPRVMLVQPGIPQERKMQGRAPADLYRDLVTLTREGLEQQAQAGLPPPDLVCWSETMLPTFVAPPDLPEAVERGARFSPWVAADWDADDFRAVLRLQRDWVDRQLLGADGRAGVLPEGTAFLSGVEYLQVVEGTIRRLNAVVLWSAPGPPQGPVPKLFLVPGAETMLGLERIASVRDVILELAGYLPDLYTDTAWPRTLQLEGRDGRTWRLAAAVCFDNAFDLPFTRPLREGAVDFHLVTSNEAWFRSSLELDQMMAFSRLEAIATGRAVVRATNSGVSAVLAPDGHELARLRVGGRDREVAGTLAAVVPVPASPQAAAARTPFVHLERVWAAAWILVPLLLLLAAARRPRAGPAAAVTEAA